MKISNVDEGLHIIDNNTDVWSVIKEIASSRNQEDAFYICDIGDIVRKHKMWKMKLPRVEPHYAVKCNDSTTVLEILASLGASFDCASKGEINLVLSIGVEPDRIIFANPAKPASHIRHAAAVGVNMMTFDNETELHKVKQLYPHAKLVIRIRCDATEAQCQLGMKFGCDPVNEAPHLLRVARELNLNVVGVSFHVGSGCQEPPVFRRAIAASREIFHYAESLGYQFNILDLGGGYPGGTGTSIDEIADIINQALDDFFPDPVVRVIAEPGRYYVSSAYTLACNIHSIRSVVNVDPATGIEKTHRMYYINDGVYGSFNCILYDHQVVCPKPLCEYVGAKHYSSSVWGPTCDGLDQVINNMVLPDMKIGEWLVFEDMGAYTLPVASPFNGFPIPKVHFIADEGVWTLMKDLITLNEETCNMIRRPESFTRSMELRTDEFILPELPITIEVPQYNGEVQKHILDFVNIEDFE